MEGMEVLAVMEGMEALAVEAVPVVWVVMVPVQRAVTEVLELRLALAAHP